MHEHVGAHVVVVPHKSVAKVVADGGGADVGKMGIKYVAVESPYTEVGAHHQAAGTHGVLAAIVGKVEAVGLHGALGE